MAIESAQEYYETIYREDTLEDAIKKLEYEQREYHSEIEDLKSFAKYVNTITPRKPHNMSNNFIQQETSDSAHKITEKYQELIMPDEYSLQGKKQLQTIKENYNLDKFVYADMIDEFGLDNPQNSLKIVKPLEKGQFSEPVKQGLLTQSKNCISSRKSAISHIEEEKELISQHKDHYSSLVEKAKSIEEDATPGEIDSQIGLWPHLEILEDKISSLAEQRQKEIHKDQGLEAEHFKLFFDEKEYTYPVLNSLTDLQENVYKLKNEI